MAISNFPSDLSEAIQKGYLEREFTDPLYGALGYRDAAMMEPFMTNIGESVTKTRASLMAIGSVAPLDPSTNTPLDNGLTPPTVWSVEQYDMGLNYYGDRTPDLNLIADKTAIASQFLRNAKNLGTQSQSRLDLIARNKLLDGYMGGNTRVIVTLGAPNVTIEVDDIRGFRFSFEDTFPTTGSSAKPVNTSVSATQQVLVGANVYTLTGALADVVNISTAINAGGISGTLTFSTTISVPDGTLGMSVLSLVGAEMIRPNGKTNTFDLASTDVFTLKQIQDAVAILENNGVPKIDGFYNCYFDATSKNEIFNDPDFLLLFRGSMLKSEEYKNLTLIDGLGVRFIQTNFAPQQNSFTNVNDAVINVHRPIIVGDEALIEGHFTGMQSYLDHANQAQSVGHVTEAKDIYMITRMPLDRQLSFISQTWLFVGGWAVPTDVLTTSATIPTASDAYFKRAVVIEHA